MTPTPTHFLGLMACLALTHENVSAHGDHGAMAAINRAWEQAQEVRS
jgi:hypothetical protein